MCNMCEHLTIETRQDDGSISAKCKIKDIKKYPKQTQKIMADYNNATRTNNARPDNECQFYYLGITGKCTENPLNNNN